MRPFLILMLCLLATDPACGQGFDPYQPINARARLARRERAIAYAGGTKEARAASEQYGDDFDLALLSCSPAVARRLAAFAAAPDGLCKLPNPPALLKAIYAPNCGDDVAVWAIQHAADLVDPDQFGAFLHKPLEVSLGLESLSTVAAQYRADRLAAAAPPPQPSPSFALPTDWKPLAVIGAAVVLVGWWLWRRRRGA